MGWLVGRAVAADQTGSLVGRAVAADRTGWMIGQTVEQGADLELVEQGADLELVELEAMTGGRRQEEMLLSWCPCWRILL